MQVLWRSLQDEPGGTGRERGEKGSAPWNYPHQCGLAECDQSYLNPNKEKLKSKGVTSVVSRIMNLQEVKKEMSHELLCVGGFRAAVHLLLWPAL